MKFLVRPIEAISPNNPPVILCLNTESLGCGYDV